MPKRESGLDLLRCFATFLVVLGHSYLSNGYTITPQVGVSMWLAGSFQLMGRCSVGIFLMLTGYLQGRKTDWKSCYRSLPVVLMSYAIAAAICIPIRHYVFGDVQSITTWAQRFFGYSGAYYGWYVEVYVGLTLLTPFLNVALNHSSNKRLLGFAAVLLFLSSLPGLTRWTIVPGFFVNLYPISYYVLGVIVRRVQPKIKPIFGLLAALASALLMGAVTVLSTDGYFAQAMTWSFGDLGMVIVSVGLFIGLYRIKLPQWLGRVFAFLASGCFGAYLLSHLLDATCYKWVIPWKKDGKLLLIFLCVTLPIYIVSLFLGIGLDQLSRLLLKPINKVTSKLGKKKISASVE